MPVFLIIILFFFFHGNSQSIITPEQIKDKTVYVVAGSDEDMFTQNLKYAIQNFWYLSRYEFVTSDKIDSLRLNTENIFLFTKALYWVSNLSRVGEMILGPIDTTLADLSFELRKYDNEEIKVIESITIIFNAFDAVRPEFIVLSIQNLQLNFLRFNPCYSLNGWKKISDCKTRIVNKEESRIHELKTKNIYISSNDVGDIKDPAGLIASSGLNVKVVEDVEIKKIILQREKNSAYFLVTRYGRKLRAGDLIQIYLVDSGSGYIYFTFTRAINPPYETGNGITRNIFKKLRNKTEE